MVKLLLKDVHINPDFKNINDWMPLSAAALNECKIVVMLLLANDCANLNSGDFSDQMSLSWAAGGENKKLMKLLLTY